MSRTVPLGVYAVVLVVQVVAQATDHHIIAGVTQVLLMPLLATYLLVQRPAPRPRLAALTQVALGCSWLGDALPRVVHGGAAFPAMVGSFLLAQVAYIVAFGPYAEGSVLRRRRLLLIPYLAALIALLALCLPAAGALAPAVLVYGCCLVTMAVLASGVHPLTWAGGALFLVSDALIALESFDVVRLPLHDAVVMATYGVAQVLILGGVLRESADEAPAATGRQPDAVPTQRSLLARGAPGRTAPDD